jgi:hypothetical protein
MADLEYSRFLNPKPINNYRIRKQFTVPKPLFLGL